MKILNVCEFYAAATLLQSPDPHAVTAPCVPSCVPVCVASAGPGAPGCVWGPPRRGGAVVTSPFLESSTHSFLENTETKLTWCIL